MWYSEKYQVATIKIKWCKNTLNDIKQADTDNANYQDKYCENQRNKQNMISNKTKLACT